jgi:hypothetical protein
MKKILLVLGIVLMAASLPLLTAPIYMKQFNPMYLGLALMPWNVNSCSENGTISPSDYIVIMEGVRLPESRNLHIEINITGGASNTATLTIRNSTYTALYPFTSSIILDLFITKEDTYSIFLNNTDTTEITYSYKVDYYIPVNPYLVTIYLVTALKMEELPRNAQYLEIIGGWLITIGILITASAVKTRKKVISLESDNVLPTYKIEGKNKVFYLCRVCSGEYPCDEKNTPSLVKLGEEALKLNKNREKEEHLKGKSKSTGSAQRDSKLSIKLSQDTSKTLQSLVLDIIDEIQKDASKNLILCPSCQHWVCKASCWNTKKGTCVICAKQKKEPKQKRKEETRVIKAKNFCPHCGTRIKDPTQIRCSKCEALLDF